jgi:hypothetical protein
MPNSLTATQVTALTKDGDWRVERNLFVQIRDGGKTRSWVFRYRYMGHVSGSGHDDLAGADALRQHQGVWVLVRGPRIPSGRLPARARLATSPRPIINLGDFPSAGAI